MNSQILLNGLHYIVNDNYNKKFADGMRSIRKNMHSVGKTMKKDVGASKKVDEYIKSIEDWRGRLLSDIRKTFHEADPDIIEEWKWRGSPVWSHDGIIAVAGAFKGKVKLTFFNGAFLSDPQKIFNTGLEGNKWRAIDFCEGDSPNKAALKNLILSAISYNRSKLKKI